MTTEELALSIIHATGGDPSKSKDVAEAIDAWKNNKPIAVQERAIDIPMDDCGLHINCGRDGVWLHFKTSKGTSASVNMASMAERNGRIIGRALSDWCLDRQEQAEKIRSNNSQVGVGA